MNKLSELTYRCVSYPDFEPGHTWLRQMLLFVDEVHRIVPPNYPLDDSDDLKRLMEHCDGAVQICPPRPYIEINDDQGRVFGRALNESTFTRVARSKKWVAKIGPRGEPEVENWEFLHVEKIGYVVQRELQERDMLRPSPWHDYWKLVPRGVGSLVVGMLADQAAEALGFDAVTDQPLAFALNSVNRVSDKSSPIIEGIIASTVASVHVPKDIALMPVEDYAELRRQNARARSEFAKMVRDLKDIQRMDRRISPVEFRKRLDGIVEHVGSEMKRFRATNAASKINDWVPFALTTILPTAIAFAFGPIPAGITGVFSFGINAIGKLTKKTEQFSYPKVLQTLCAADDAAAKAAVRNLIK
jgi:hypothetical protein